MSKLTDLVSAMLVLTHAGEHLPGEHDQGDHAPDGGGEDSFHSRKRVIKAGAKGDDPEEIAKLKVGDKVSIGDSANEWEVKSIRKQMRTMVEWGDTIDSPTTTRKIPVVTLKVENPWAQTASFTFGGEEYEREKRREKVET